MRAVLLAMSDRIDDARALVRVIREHARDLGQAALPDPPEVESFSGNHDAAVEQLGLWLAWDREHGITGNVAYTSAEQGRELALAGRYEEAEQCAVTAREHRDNSPVVKGLWRQVIALVHASRGEHADAVRLAREALTFAHETDSPVDQGYAYCDLAEVLEAAGRREEAIAAWREALDRYERKGIIPLARRVRERLAALQEAPA
jgi:tetratricopeptide (TPR) repeat protein